MVKKKDGQAERAFSLQPFSIVIARNHTTVSGGSGVCFG
jgi:hypothetical protein